MYTKTHITDLYVLILYVQQCQNVHFPCAKETMKTYLNGNAF